MTDRKIRLKLEEIENYIKKEFLEIFTNDTETFKMDFEDFFYENSFLKIKNFEYLNKKFKESQNNDFFNSKLKNLIIFDNSKKVLYTHKRHLDNFDFTTPVSFPYLFSFSKDIEEGYFFNVLKEIKIEQIKGITRYFKILSDLTEIVYRVWGLKRDQSYIQILLNLYVILVENVNFLRNNLEKTTQELYNNTHVKDPFVSDIKNWGLREEKGKNSLLLL